MLLRSKPEQLRQELFAAGARKLHHAELDVTRRHAPPRATARA